MNTFLKHTLLLILISFCTANLIAQNNISVLFNHADKQLFPGELLTNTIKVTNTGSQTQTIKITVDYPYGWKQIGQLGAKYTINPGDTVFVPLRLITVNLLGGNNKYMVNANVLSEDERFLAGATFWAFTKKQTSWAMSCTTGNKIYFKNGENSAKFGINILNTGAETQPITLTLNNISLFATVIDSVGNNKVTKPIQMQLQNQHDTTFNFIYKHESAQRNFTRIDIENYKPHTNNDDKTFTLFVNSEEPNLGQEGAFSSSQRLVFRKLSDRTQSNPNAFTTMPIVFDYNVSNLLDNVSFSTLNIRGSAQVNSESQLTFNIQTSATSDRYDDVLKSTNYYLGYFHNKGNVQLGFVNGGFLGMQSFGKGIKAGYNMGKRNSINAFLVNNSDRNGERYLVAKGVSYQLRYFKQNKIGVEYGESENTITGVTSKVLNLKGGINFLRTQTISGTYSHTWNKLASQNTNTSGRFYLVNYGGSFFKNKISINHTLGNNEGGYSSSKVERIFYNHRTRLNFKSNWNVTLVNNYNKTQSAVLFNSNVTSLNNQLSLTKAYKQTSVMLSGIYNTFEFTQASSTVKAVGFTHNTFKPKEYMRFSANMEAGITSPKSSDTLISTKTTPYLLFSSMLFYKTITVNARYIMGSYGATPAVNVAQNGITQQLFSSAVQHQYVFNKTQFMLQNGVNYFYNNIFKQHTLNISPELYYFTSTGWRFRAGLNYNVISGMALRNAYNNQTIAEEVPRVTNHGLFVTLGVRKEFNAPIPFKKTKFIESEFVAFFDVNGNGVKDKNERAIENVVIRVNEDEVITNVEGTASIVNASAGMGKIAVMPLDEIEGWFANIGDSVMLLKSNVNYIPFVKGVKIRGRVTIQRENISADADEPFDLSRIKITATGIKNVNTLTGYDGTFEFYLPFGNYTISFDETVLGDKFKLTKNNYNIAVTKDADGMVLSYHIIEKTRKVNKKVFTQPASR